jgi:hypothetical protein
MSDGIFLNRRMILVCALTERGGTFTISAV